MKKVVQDLTSGGIDWQREKWQSGLGSKFIHQGEKNAVKYADEVIVLSKGVQGYFKETYGRETHFIPNGVNRPQIREASLITDKFGLKKDSYILFLGRLVPEKGIRYLVEAFKNVKTDKKLVIAGGSSDTDSFMEELKELAKGDDRILFTGFVQGAMLDELYSNAYIYTLPSDLEGMPLSLLEAMSYGNCCLVSDIPECAEVVEDKALIFKKSDVEDLREKLQDACDHPEMVMKMKKQAADFICAKYNWDLKHLQKSLMDLCNREFLYQVDLLSPSRTGVTEAEYWAQRRLDEKKQEIEKEGFTPNLTKFQTQKQLIRDAVAAAREKAISYEDFQDILQDEYNIFVKTQRGRYSYLLPERNKFISERSLGDSCKRECLEGLFVQNAEKNLRYKEDPILIFTTRTRLRLVVDLQENVKAQENLAYALKVKISNLQKMAETLVWVQENNINDLTELNDLCKTAQANAQAAYERLSQAEDELYKTNEQIHYAGQYLSTKEVQQQFTKAIFKKKFRAEHSKELDAYVESVKYFREENDGKLPSLKFLKKRKEELTKEIAERKKVYTPLKEESRRLEVASDNVYSIFRKTNEMKSDLAWKREWEARVREKARQEQVRQEQRVRQPKRKKRSYDVSL